MGLATKDGIVEEGHFCLTDESTVFADEVHVIKEVIADALRKSLDELDIYSDSRSALQVLYSLVPHYKAVAKIRGPVRNRGIKVHMHWIKTHIRYAYNEHPNLLAEEAATHPTVNMQIPLSCRQMKRRLFGQALID